MSHPRSKRASRHRVLDKSPSHVSTISSHDLKACHKHGSSKTDRSRHERRCDRLRKLTKCVYRMVSDDRKHNSIPQSDELEGAPATSCGCPYNCGHELKELRLHVKNLYNSLPPPDKAPPMMLEDYVESRGDLLREVWKIIGPVHFRELVSDELLEVCHRREKRGTKHVASYNHDFPENWLTPPFTSFEPKNNSTSTPGLFELWRRCLFELNELSSEQVKHVLSGLDVQIPILLPYSSIDNATSKDVSEKNICDPANQKSRTPFAFADSTSNSFTPEVRPSSKPRSPSAKLSPESLSRETVAGLSENEGTSLEMACDITKDRACLEITELEMRARLIRAMLASKNKSKLEESI